MLGRAMRWTLWAMPLLVALLCLTASTPRSGAAAPTGASAELPSVLRGTPPLVVERPQTRVLFLHSHGPDDGYTVLQTQGMKEALEARAPGAVIGYHEYLFLSLRGEDDDYHHSLTKLLQKRYSGLTIDLVAITDTRALEFWVDHMQAALPGVPAVFSGSNTRFPQLDDPARNITGAMEHTDVRGTIALIRSLRPATRHLVVLTTNTFFGRRMMREIEDDLRGVDPGLRVTFSLPTVLEDCLEPLNRPDPADVLLFVSAPTDGPAESRAFAPQWLQSRVPGGVPVFCLFDGALGPDCIGGVVCSGKEMGRIAGEAAARILYDHVKPSDIPIDSGSGSVRPMFRWDVMRKWGITEAMLPKGSVIVGRPDSWLMRYEADIYRWTAIGTTTIACALAGVIWGLVVARRRRRSAEIARDESELRLRHAVLGASLGTWECDVATGDIIGSDLFNAMYGIHAGRPFTKAEGLPRIHPEDQGGVTQAWYACIEGKGPYRLTYRYMIPSGEYRWFRIEGDVVRDAFGHPWKVVGVSADVTENMESRHALEESQRRLAEVIRTAPLAIIEWDDQWRCTRWDGMAEAMFGWNAKEVLGRSHDDIRFIHPDDAAETRRRVAEHEALRTPTFHCTNRHFTKSGEVRICEWTKANKYDQNGKRISTLSMVSDVTEREESRRLQALSDERYRFALRAASDIIWDWDIVNDRVHWSDSARELPKGAAPAKGLTVAEWIDHLHVDDRERVRTGFFGAVNEPGVETWQDEYRMFKEDGSMAYFTDTAFIVRDSAGRAVRMVGAMSDITATRQADEQLAASESKLRAAMTAAGLGTFDVDLTTGRMDHDERTAELFGLPPGGRIHDFDARRAYFHPEDVPSVCERERFALSTGQDYRCEARVRHADGQYRWILGQASIMKDANGVPVRAVGVVGDIHERKTADDALRKSEERFREIAQTVDQAFWIRSLQTKEYEYLSPAVARMLGVREEELPRHLESFRRYVHPDDIEELLRGSRAWAEAGFPDRLVQEYRMIRPDGSVRWWRSKAFAGPRGADGKPTRLMGTTEDVTDKIESSQRLAKSEQKFRQIAENIPQVFWTADPGPDGLMRYASDAVKQVFGISTGHVEGTEHGWAHLIHPDDRAAADKARIDWHAAGCRGTYENHYRIIRADGELRHVLNRGYAVRDEQGRVVRITGLAEDITERELAHQRLTESERRFREMAENIDQVFWTRSIDRPEVEYVSPATKRLWGVEPAELTGSVNLWRRMIHPDDRERVRELIDRWISAGAVGQYEAEFRLVTPKGETRWVRSRAAAVGDTHGSPMRIVGMSEDITEREVARQRLTESERRFREMAENIDQVFWVRTVENAETLYLSPATKRLWGFDPSEMTGTVNKWREMIHPEDRERVVRDIGRWFAQGAKGTYSNEYRFMLADGSIRWVSNRGTLVPSRDSLPARMVGVSEDITHRKTAEMALESTLRTQRLLLSELDHRVKNNLAGLLALIEMNGVRERSVPGFAESMRRRVGAMVEVHAVLSSARWEAVDLSQMVSALAPADVPGRLAIDGPPVRIPASKATPLGMILQELLSNSEKYGALSVHGGEVHLRWSCEQTSDSSVMTLHWGERGGPPIEAQPVGGLGTSLIEGFARYELRGWAEMGYPRGGASHTISVDISVDSTKEARQGTSSTGTVLSTITTGV